MEAENQTPETQESPAPNNPPPATGDVFAPPLPKRRGRPPGSKNKPKVDENGNPIAPPAKAPTPTQNKPTEEWPPPNPAHVAFFQTHLLQTSNMLAASLGPHWGGVMNPATREFRPYTPDDFVMPASAIAQIAGDKLANPYVILAAWAVAYIGPNALITFKMYQETKKAELARNASAAPTAGGAPAVAVGG